MGLEIYTYNMQPYFYDLVDDESNKEYNINSSLQYTKRAKIDSLILGITAPIFALLFNTGYTIDLLAKGICSFQFTHIKTAGLIFVMGIVHSISILILGVYGVARPEIAFKKSYEWNEKLKNYFDFNSFIENFNSSENAFNLGIISARLTAPIEGLIAAIQTLAIGIFYLTRSIVAIEHYEYFKGTLNTIKDVPLFLIGGLRVMVTANRPLVAPTQPQVSQDSVFED